LGATLATESGTSDATVHIIEDETRRILGNALSLAEGLLAEKRAELDRLVSALLENETVEKPEIIRLVGPGAAGSARSPSASAAFS
jgi:ATP-dependent Zn protease